MPAADGFRSLELTLGPCEAALLHVDAVAPVKRETGPLAGAPGLGADLMSGANAMIKKSGVAVLKYEIPEGAVTFAAAGFANQDEKSSAIFRVLVDGKEKYNSGVMRLGSPVQPVVVDLSGGKLLELITEEAGDGLYGDYTFWGEARLIKR